MTRYEVDELYDPFFCPACDKRVSNEGKPQNLDYCPFCGCPLRASALTVLDEVLHGPHESDRESRRRRNAW